MSHWFDRLARASIGERPQSRRQLARWGLTTAIGDEATAERALDNAARQLSAPVSRRRALALLGTAAGATAVGGIRPRRAWAQGRCAPGYFFCGEGDGCCPNGTTCCKGTFACCPPGKSCCGRGCCADTGSCCPADEFGRAACCDEPGSKCKPDDTSEYGWSCTRVCPDGRAACGPEEVCCDEDKVCAFDSSDSPRCTPRCRTGESADGSPITCYVYDAKTKVCKDTCPPDQHCDFRGIRGGGCIPKCEGACRVYDSRTGTCKDNCGPDHVCDWRGITSTEEGGTCIPRCMLSCSPYDSATGTCKDMCGPGKTCRASDDGGRTGTCDCPVEDICGRVCCPADWFCVDGSCAAHLPWKVATPKTVTATEKDVVGARVSCPGPGTCSGTVTIVAVNPPTRSRVAGRTAATPIRQVVLGRRRFKVPAKRTASVQVKLSSTGRALLRSRKKLNAQAQVASAGGIESADRFTLKAPRRR